MPPALRIPLSLNEIFLKKISQIARAASPNRKVKKTKGEEKESAVLTNGKVVPQIKVNKRRDSSALRDGLNIFQQIAPHRP